MKKFSRRDILKSSVLASAAVTVRELVPMAAAMEIAPEATEPFFEPPLRETNDEAMKRAGRERLLLDFGWRFHFGHADDPSKDFGFTGNFQKTGNFVPAGALAFDDSQWRALDLPHDWAVELPFRNDPALRSKGFYPLGKKYPATSVGWYRRVFELPAEAKGKRITVEFDGAYRETMVVFNNFYIGRHSGGYDPFSFDLTDFATPGGLERWMVLRGRRNLPSCVASEDESRLCAAMGHVRESRCEAPGSESVGTHRGQQ